MMLLCALGSPNLSQPLPSFTCPRQAEGYDPKRSKVSDDTLNDFLRAPLSGLLSEVPGIGPATIKKLADSELAEDEKITNTFQLIGKFMMLKGPDAEGSKVESFEHMEKFWYFLQNRGISSHRGAIVRSIAEKMNTMMPGIYDADAYDDDEA
jgi:hypothetical protein